MHLITKSEMYYVDSFVLSFSFFLPAKPTQKVFMNMSQLNLGTTTTNHVTIQASNHSSTAVWPVVQNFCVFVCVSKRDQQTDRKGQQMRKMLRGDTEPTADGVELRRKPNMTDHICPQPIHHLTPQAKAPSSSTVLLLAHHSCVTAGVGVCRGRGSYPVPAPTTANNPAPRYKRGYVEKLEGVFGFVITVFSM